MSELRRDSFVKDIAKAVECVVDKYFSEVSDDESYNSKVDHQMRRLTAGKVPKGYLELLFSLTKSSSLPVKGAVFAHLVEGMEQSEVAKEFQVKPSAISRKVRDISDINFIVSSLAKFHIQTCMYQD
ncbi:adhesin biosynthesis transcription regulatory family protein [Shewanella sp. D64]|uniref:hypothetical protein n=1 Tax=unclassified Shewanella TaxID=196818 RepID=UPI0022BA12D2|nr:MULTISPECIES: hypothetical protein [unclassified Shewanella]MEC4725339.1 adhesin biosynthesis transcription regulatory family protein [Shewanella sp. D64]MEC4735815.1 adhesin biosynthesis transcription regulatory family protein [Shewanella sp. E94]WBJ93214.1 adhesin biosynthesis transcription regulatory family protein [Shewanella sp. MTB7]